MQYTKTELTPENLVTLLDKLFIENGKPVGDADNKMLSFAESYHARKATLADIPILMKFIGYSVYLTPATMPESNFNAEGISA